VHRLNDVLAIQGPSQIAQNFIQHWYVYIGVIILAGFIGWITKVIAIEMMFRPIDFKGVKLGPIPLGWQGVLPRRAAHMASVANDMLIGEGLLDPKELIDRLDPERVAEAVREPLLESIEQITHEVASSIQPGLWDNLPDSVRNMIVSRVQGNAPEVVKRILEDIQANIYELFDMRNLLITVQIREKEILQKVFREAGKGEWAFIRRFGLYAGLLIGLVQVVVYLIFQSPFVNPLIGLLNGWLTDLIAIKVLLFRPHEEKRFWWLGGIKWQGLFLSRQDEVAEDLGKLYAEELLTPAHVVESLMKGPRSDRLFLMIQRHMQTLVDEQAGLAKPLVVLTVGSANYVKMKQMVAERVMETLPETMRHADEYSQEALDIQNMLADKLKQLPPEKFEGVLRPAFQQDEWILIATGAALGGAVGFLQDGIIQLFAK
jgi:uncharacterized membrane protein YheB (UPF0754 family)